jgi:hypothetical protein
MWLLRRTAAADQVAIFCHRRLILLLTLFVGLLGDLVIPVLSLEASSFPFGLSTSLLG